MITMQMPGMGRVQLKHLLLDLNGTLTVDGALLEGVGERVSALSRQLSVHLVTADTRGTAQEIADELDVDCLRLERGREAEQKKGYVESYGAQHIVAVGNGHNDALMLAAARVGVVVIGPEGTSTKAFTHADVITASIDEALDLLLKPKRLLATLRH
ncbi:MAG: HAD family hydrolase [Anaerolineales bacterium]